MNIFYLDHNYTYAAQYLCDKHVVKMTLETAQILSSAHHIHNNITCKNYVYKPTHIKHPSVQWVSSHTKHYEWTYNLFLSLLHEYSIRYNKTHKSSLLLPWLYINPIKLYIDDNKFIDPPQCMPEKYRCTDTVTAYRSYYIHEKYHFASWNRSKYGIPHWFILCKS